MLTIICKQGTVHVPDGVPFSIHATSEGASGKLVVQAGGISHIMATDKADAEQWAHDIAKSIERKASRGERCYVFDLNRFVPRELACETNPHKQPDHYLSDVPTLVEVKPVK